MGSSSSQNIDPNSNPLPKTDPIALMNYSEVNNEKYINDVKSFINAQKIWLDTINNETNPIITETYSWIRHSIQDAINKMENKENTDINKKRLVFLIGLLIWKYLSENYKIKYGTQCSVIETQLRQIAAMGGPKSKIFSESLWKFKNDITNIKYTDKFNGAIKIIVDELEKMVVMNRKFGGHKIRHQTKHGGYRPTKRNRTYYRLWKKGKPIGFTMTSSLKAKGLIPRANGTRRVSKKYR